LTTQRTDEVTKLGVAVAHDSFWHEAGIFGASAKLSLIGWACGPDRQGGTTPAVDPQGEVNGPYIVHCVY
jgi:hypothetical protein